MFPFEIPADLTALSAEEFAAFAATVRAHAQTVVADEAASSDMLLATRDLHAQVTAEDTRRTETAAAASAARAELAAGLAPAPVAEPPAVVPATAPTEPVPAPEPTGNPPIPAVVYSTSTRGKRNDIQKIGAHAFAINGRTLSRHGGAQITREFPADLRITDDKDALAVLDHATDEHRLPGGSLIASMEHQLRAVKDGGLGKSLTAAVGWCAPSETMYELCSLETLDGMLDIPEVQATRGGFFVPENGGPNFSVIWDSIGDEGDVILTEYDVENGVEKVCVEIPCPPFVEVRLDVAYLCITGSLLQRRGYPEAVTRFSQGALVALAHKVNESVIARIVAQSGSPVTISADASGDDAASALLSAVELAIEDMKYRNRMGRTATIEIVLPAWVIAPIRAALSRRTGVAAINVTDAEILAAFTTRHAVPRFVYDWQDAYSGQANSPGSQTPITAFPTTVRFLAYPAGTWVKPVRDVINLDTVYDNALLTENQYTALFAEDGFNVIKMCADSRLYQAPIDVSGVVGCCP